MEALTLRGARCLFTDNDCLDAPMLTINKKLGYCSLPGLYCLRANLAKAAAQPV